MRVTYRSSYRRKECGVVWHAWQEKRYRKKLWRQWSRSMYRRKNQMSMSRRKDLVLEQSKHAGICGSWSRYVHPI
jgi:hypothetical protein